MHPYADLAKKTVEEYVKSGKIPTLSEPIPEDMKKKSWCFCIY